MSLLADIADEIVSSINGASLSVSLTAKRSPLPVFDLGLVGSDVVVSVIPKALALTVESRTEQLYDVETDVGVQKRVQRESNTEVDEMFDLVQEIGDVLRFTDYTSVGGARWVSMTNDPAVFPDHLENDSVFTSLITVTHRVLR